MPNIPQRPSVGTPEGDEKMNRPDEQRSEVKTPAGQSSEAHKQPEASSEAQQPATQAAQGQAAGAGQTAQTSAGSSQATQGNVAGAGQGAQTSQHPHNGGFVAAGASQQPGGGTPIVIQMPEQPRPSRAPWIILAVIALILTLTLGSCIAVPSMMIAGLTKDLSEQSFDSTGMNLHVTEDSIGVFHMSDAISAEGGTNPEQIRNILKAAEKNPHIKAVVVRVNCPGGTVAASEEIATYIKDFSKPIVFSVSDMCASGAYMAASQSDYIMAMSTSEVGSIGVLMQTLDISEFLQRHGIKMDAITSAESKDAGAVYRSLTQDEREKLQKEVAEVNEKFINIVARGRSMDRDKVAALATGETFAGDKAREYGLIDGLGTYEDAILQAAELAHISLANVSVYDLDPVPSFFDMNSLFGVSNQGSLIDALKALGAVLSLDSKES